MATGFAESEDQAADSHQIKLDEMKKAAVNIGMLSRVAESDAHFMHQQRGEPDLTLDKKLQIATQVLEKNPVTFLSRFGRYLTASDLEYFDDIKNQYEIRFHLQEIQKHLDDKQNETTRRNRRFEAMKKMMEQGDYFSAEMMKERNPFLYDQLIGQYQTQEEIQSQIDGKDLNFSAILIEHVQALANTALYQELSDMEHGQTEEVDSDEEDIADTDSTNPDGISKVEKQMFKNEFLRTMQLRFLNGEDDFDYRTVDENEKFDSLDIREQDEEEKYFDDEDDDDEGLPLNFTVANNSIGNFCSETTDISKYTNHRVAGQSENETSTSLNDMDCDRESASQEDAETDIDYNDYVVTSDVRPGLNTGDSLKSKPSTDEKSDNTVT